MTVLTGYIRVSGDAQEYNASLPLQRKAIEDYCKQNRLTLFNIFEDVCSGSGMDDRQGLQFALNTVFADLSDGIIVHKLDRFSRSSLDSEFCKSKLKEHNKVLISTSDPVDIQMPEGELFFSMKSAFAEYERKSINIRCAAGRARKKAECGYYGGGPPYGWIALHGTLVEYEPEQKGIRRIYTLQREGYSLHRIACIMNEEGYSTKRGRRWKRAQVWAVLQGVPEVVIRLGA